MRRSVSWLLVGSMAALRLLAAETDTPESVAFNAQIVDGEGQPISGASAEFYQYPTPPLVDLQMALKKKETANSSGVLQVQVPKGCALVVIRHPSWAPAWLNFYQAIDTQQRIVLSHPTNLIGVVTDSANAPVGNAEVWVETALIISSPGPNRQAYNMLGGNLARETFSARTSADGRFTITGFPTNATASVVARAPGKAIHRTQADYSGPQSLSQPGTEEIKLTLEPAGRVEGKVVAGDSNQAPPQARIVLQAARNAWSGSPILTSSGSDGSFALEELSSGDYRLQAAFGTNTPPDWVAEQMSLTVEAGQTNRDLVINAVRGGLLEVAVFDELHNPVANANVGAYRENHGTDALSSSSGTALLRLPPGEYQVTAYKENLRTDPSAVTMENGVTNRLEFQFKAPPKISGTVTTPDGTPVEGIKLTVFPEWGINSTVAVKTDADGHYEMIWDRRQSGQSDQTFCLIAQDKENGLAVARDLEESTSDFDLQLQPGLALFGKVEEPESKPITNASVSVTLWSGNMGANFGEPASVDAEGRFKITSLPAGRRYSISASAPGHGSVSRSVTSVEGETNAVEIETFVLRIADQELAGQVLDENEKPAQRAQVSIQGEGQPNLNLVTDLDGRFKATVCEGRVRLWAHMPNAYGSGSAESGDTNVVLQLRSYSRSERAVAKRTSLKGRPLPDLSPLGLSTNVATTTGPLLLCLFDAEQRPSRRCVKGLAEQNDAFVKNSVVVLVAQARVTADETFQEWKAGNPLPFAVGQLKEKTPATKWVVDVESMPWLILIDSKRNVVDEGFGLDELESKLEALGK